MVTQKVAIFDFCQTIVDFETADEFVRYVLKHMDRKYRLIDWLRKALVVLQINRIIEKITRNSYNRISINKKLLLFQLRGLGESQINKMAEDFYCERIEPHLINKTIKELLECKNKGYQIALVSASYLPIIQPFYDKYEIDYLITNTFRYKDGKFLGVIDSNDCVGKEKVRRFYHSIKDKDKIEIEYSYGDSKSDIPILKIARQGVVISHCNSKPWAKECGFKEIVWT